MLYSLYLSCIDLGDSVSAWITAPIIQDLNITFDEQQNSVGLATLVEIAAALKAVFICFLPFLFVK